MGKKSRLRAQRREARVSRIGVSVEHGHAPRRHTTSEDAGRIVLAMLATLLREHAPTSADGFLARSVERDASGEATGATVGAELDPGDMIVDTIAVLVTLAKAADVDSEHIVERVRRAYQLLDAEGCREVLGYAVQDLKAEMLRRAQPSLDALTRTGGN